MLALWLVGGALLGTVGLVLGWNRLHRWWANRHAERGARDYLRRRGDALRRAQQEKPDTHRWE